MGHCFDIGRDYGERCQCRGADCKALADCCGGITQFIKLIGDLADLFTQSGHLSNAPRVVCHRSIGINGHRDSDGCEHTDSSDTDSVKA